MLPKIPGSKSAVFTQRICAYNETFSPIGKKIGDSYAILWHQGVKGRDDEDITSAVVKFLANLHCDLKQLVIWMDNCTSQNKNWTIFSSMVKVMNLSQLNLNIEVVTFKYFEKGHSFMLAVSTIELNVSAKKSTIFMIFMTLCRV